MLAEAGPLAWCTCSGELEMNWKIYPISDRQPGVSRIIKRVGNLFFDMNTKKELSLFELPENTRVSLEDDFRKKMFETLLHKFGSFSKTSKELGLNKGEDARRYLIGRSGIPLKALVEISQTTKIPETEIQLHVSALKTLKSKKKIAMPNLPIKLLTKEFGLVIGGVMGDGSIEKTRKRVSYFSAEPNQIESFKQAVLKTFGKVEFAYHRSMGGTPCVLFPKIIGEILCQIGLEEGNKNYKHNLGIPKLFMKNPKSEAMISLIRRLFDDDGTVAHHHCNRGIEFIAPTIFRENEKVIEPRILIDLKKIFMGFGIRTHIRNYSQLKKPNSETTHCWKLVINGKENLQIFYDKIGFGLTRKQAIVKEVLEMYVEGLEFYPRFHAEENYLTAIKEMAEKNIKVTANSLSQRCKRNTRHIREVLLELTKRNLVKRELVKNRYFYKTIVAGGA
ncbi:LAGLIDADG-like domain protein [uncultured archaeon]|nr:LAGLIDADG-like domain protein [uncultured archaeon]